MREIVGRWFGVYVVDDGRVTDSTLYPLDAAALCDRALARHRGEVTEEESALRLRLGAGSLSRDRRLVAPEGPELGRGAETAEPTPPGVTPELRREVLLAVAAEELSAAWDPSVHVEEAVRSTSDLDGIANSLGERLVSWGGRDLVDRLEEEPTAERIARYLTEETSASPDRAPVEPELAVARRSMAALYREILRVREEVERAVTAAMPRRAPNLSALLGPVLAGRLVALAGGIDRLARLPASTIQVLGAERAFFEHLRGRAPPPRHGVLFRHPQIQGAPRRQRGRLARALAGKAAIAARLDRAHAPLRPDLSASWEARAKAIRQAPAPRREPRRGSRAPLHRAADDR